MARDKKKRTLYIDVDQTLVAPDGSLRPHARTMLARLTERGYRVILWSAAGPRWDVVQRHHLEAYVSDCVGKPFPVEDRPWTAAFTRIRRRLASAVVIDDDPAVIRVFGGIQVTPYWQADPTDRSLLEALNRIEAGRWQAAPPVASLVPWRIVVPTTATVGGLVTAFLLGLLRLLLPAAITFQTLSSPSAVFAASFGAINNIATSFDAPVATVVADIDGDGFDDVVVARQGSGPTTSSLFWYENSCAAASCSPTWTQRTIEADLDDEASSLAVAENVFGSGGLSTALVASITLGSWTPAANELVLVAVALRDEDQTVTVSGNGLTWVEVLDVNNAQNVAGVNLFRGMGSSPTTGQITVNFSGTTIAVGNATRFTGADTSGTDGSGAIEATASAQGPPVTDDNDMLVSITTVNDNAFAYAAGTHRLATFTVPTGETEILRGINCTQNCAGDGGQITTLSTWYEARAAAGTGDVGALDDLNSARDWAVASVSIMPGGRFHGLAVADLDLDGDKDVVASTGEGQDIYIYLNNGSGTFTRMTAANLVNVGSPIHSIIVADLDKDSYPDIIAHVGATGTAVNDIRRSLNPCTATSGSCSLSGLTWPALSDIDGDTGDLPPGTDITIWNTLQALDVDGDGFRDIVGISPTNQDLIWWENPCTSGGSQGSACTGFGNFTQRNIDLALGANPRTVFAGTLGSDSDVDIAVGLADGTVDVFYSDGASPPTFTKRDSVASGMVQVNHILFTKIDTDSDVDLVVVSGSTDDDVSWWSSDGGTDAAFTLTEQTLIDANLDDGNSAWIGDFNADGARDVLAVGNAADVVGWYSGSATPTAVTTGSVSVRLPSPLTGEDLGGGEPQRSPGPVIISWRSASEYNTAGYNLYRSTSKDGPWEKVNDALIPAKAPGDIGGASYSFVDAAVGAGLKPAPTYRLEEVSLDGSSSLYEPRVR